MYRTACIFLLHFLLSCGSEFADNQTENVVRDDQDKIVSGEVKKYFVTGKLEAVFNFTNYKLDGPARKYYDDGTTLRSELNYKDGKLEGMQKRYYESGALYKEEPYVDGERHGLVKKYRENGRLMTEVSYKMGQPGTILKEYLTDGSLKTRYPKIVVEEINTLDKNGEYLMRISMSDQSTDVKYYFGELDEEYFNDDLVEQRAVFDGVLELKAILQPGEMLRQDLNIVARMPTRLNNAYITTHRIRLDISR